MTQVDTVRFGNAFVPHVSVGDLEQVVVRARALGAEIVEADGALPGVGRYADLRDPDASLFTVIQFSAGSQG